MLARDEWTLLRLMHEVLSVSIYYAYLFIATNL
jgi:hypothetical protein